MERIHEGRFYVVDFDETEEVFLVERTQERADDLELLGTELRVVSQRMEESLRLPRGRGIVLDLRSAGPRNDDEFEGVMSSYRRTLHARFGRVAVVVATEVGKLHIGRMDRQDGTESTLFTDLDEALRFARAR